MDLCTARLFVMACEMMRRTPFQFGGFLVESMSFPLAPFVSLSIGSLAVALPLQDTLANFFSGIYMAVEKPIRVGDFVKLDSGEAP